MATQIRFYRGRWTFEALAAGITALTRHCESYEYEAPLKGVVWSVKGAWRHPIIVALNLSGDGQDYPIVNIYQPTDWNNPRYSDDVATAANIAQVIQAWADSDDEFKIRELKRRKRPRKAP